jgi:hypothetical protein
MKHEFFDFEITMDIMTRSRGSCGVVFRMIDPFNFLALDINIEEAYKRIIKVVNGNIEVLQKLDDGGMSQNNWFKLYIKGQKDKFEIRFGDDKKFTDYKASPKIFEFQDITLPRGEIGIFVNGNNNFYFDNFKVRPLYCQTKWEMNPDIKIMSDSSDIFDEYYNMNINLKYDVKQALNLQDGPGNWLYKQSIGGRDTVIYQTSRAHDNSDFSEGTMLIRKNKILNKNGSFDVEFRAEYQGVVGIIFKYKDENNYYTFEIGGGDDISKRFFQLRKKINGTFSLLKRFNSSEEISSVPFFGYEVNNWYSITILVKNDEIAVSGALIGTTAKSLILLVKDDSIPRGALGYSTNGTTCAFSEIGLLPILTPKSIFFLDNF